MPNNDALLKALTWATIEWRKELAGDECAWRQDRWFCETAACIAGHAALAAGARESTDYAYVFYRGTLRRVSKVANEAFGTTENAGFGGLFYSGNTILDLWKIANRITGNAFTIPDDVLGTPSQYDQHERSDEFEEPY